MIYVNITGGLGNQMFQYALARKYQLKTNQKIILNIYELKKYKLTRTYQLDGFKISPDVEISTEKLPWYVHRRNYINKIFRSISSVLYLKFAAKFFNSAVWYKEYNVEIPNLKSQRDIFLGGYWQSAYYFSDIDDVIRKEFTAININQSNNELYSKIINTQSICVTIRRGDYVTDKKFKKKYFLCDNDYFLKGIQEIKKTIPNAVTFVFSDDIDWVRANVPFTGEVYYESGNDDVWEKLRLMSACKHFVISNSSFSWWAQHLSSYRDKIVYAPSRWYPNGRKCDIYEETWKYIEI